MAHSLIIDGEYNEESIKQLPISKKDVNNICASHKCDIKDVFLLTLDDEGKTHIIMKEKQEN